jgi:hypothetical protein
VVRQHGRSAGRESNSSAMGCRGYTAFPPSSMTVIAKVAGLSRSLTERSTKLSRAYGFVLLVHGPARLRLWVRKPHSSVHDIIVNGKHVIPLYMALFVYGLLFAYYIPWIIIILLL